MPGARNRVSLDVGEKRDEGSLPTGCGNVTDVLIETRIRMRNKRGTHPHPLLNLHAAIM